MSGCLKWIIILALLPFALYTLAYAAFFGALLLAALLGLT
jgi:hypothetical protein